LDFYRETLKNFTPKHDFFIGFDSDGTVFDTLELKLKECFIPKIIKHWKLQSIAKYARETAEFVNLYSKWRGANRFPALVTLFDLLRDRPEVRRRGFNLPDLTPLRAWVNSGTALGNPTLAQVVAETQNPVLRQALEWSEAVNQAVAEMVQGITPFPLVRETLQKIQPLADAIVVSIAPCATLRQEWDENQLTQFVAVLAGQEMGNKTEQLKLAIAGRYAANHTLMLGDAPGDFQAAQANHVLFYPILPGREETAWQQFYEEALDKFLNQEYAGAYEFQRLAEFEKCFRNTAP
jgi:phosphoglycolate phosphatase-like HAD superfamily hydrolase